MSSRRIDETMVNLGLLSPTDAGTLAVAAPPYKELRFASRAVLSGKVSEEEALKALSQQLGLPAVDIRKVVISRAVIQRIPREIAQKNLLLPLAEDGGKLLVAVANPTDWQVFEEIGFATGLSVLPHAALHFRLIEIIPLAYGSQAPFFRAPLAEGGLETINGFVPIILGEQPNTSPLGEIEIEIDVSEPAVPEIITQPKPHNGDKKRILVVEDDPEISALVVNTLKSLGHEIISSTRGLEALELIKTQQPHLLVLDAMLPEVHGFEICRKVKESKRFGHVPVLMLSAVYRGWQTKSQILKTYKIDEFLEKPFRVSELLKAAKKLLQEPLDDIPENLSQEAQEFLAAGIGAIKNQRYDEAITNLRNAESIEPFSSRIQYLFGCALEKEGRIFQAIYHYERAVELQPKHFAASKSLATLYDAKGFKNKAISMWERCMMNAPDEQIRQQLKNYLASLT